MINGKLILELSPFGAAMAFAGVFGLTKKFEPLTRCCSKLRSNAALRQRTGDDCYFWSDLRSDLWIAFRPDCTDYRQSDEEKSSTRKSGCRTLVN